MAIAKPWFDNLEKARYAVLIARQLKLSGHQPGRSRHQRKPSRAVRSPGKLSNHHVRVNLGVRRKVIRPRKIAVSQKIVAEIVKSANKGID